MAGFIVLEDGRAYAANNWSYDAVIERIARALPETGAGRALSDWLMDQRSVVQGAGLGSVDLRELAPGDQRLFVEAVEKAIITSEEESPEGWCDPAFYPGWLESFHDLSRMIASIRRGEPPTAFNPHIRDVIPPSGERAGPGWGDG
jgi:hypothetical protein